MNKELFIEKYINFFIEFCINALNAKTNIDICDAIFLTLGEMSLQIKKKIFEPIINPLLNLIQVLFFEKKIFEKEIFNFFII